MASSYTIHRACHTDFSFASPLWQDVPALTIDHFSPRSSDHRPHTRARIAYDSSELYIRFDVDDRYVRCVASDYQQPVCRDSCVEFFFRPRQDRGYFNLEINCGGTILCYYIEDWTRTPDGFVKYTPLPVDLLRGITVLHTLRGPIDPEITDPTSWSIAARIPLAMLEPFIGQVGALPGQTWRGNLYKCGDQTSHPHWATWSPLGEKLNFHQPDSFGELRFAQPT